MYEKVFISNNDLAAAAGDDTVFTPSYPYTLDDAATVKNAVMAGAGPTGE